MLVVSSLYSLCICTVISIVFASPIEESEGFSAAIAAFSPTGASAASPSDPYALFVNHFSSGRSSTGLYLQAQLAKEVDGPLVVTLDGNFQPHRFAPESEGTLHIHQKPNSKLIKHIAFKPAAKRLDGPGSLVEDVVFATYELSWNKALITGIKASWVEGFAQVTQWHLYGSDEQTIKSLIETCAAHFTALREAVWVYDQMHWSQDRALWQTIQHASWKDVILENAFKRQIIHDYESFFKSEAIYKEYGVPWKRGAIFYGPAGNGKTVSIKAIMKNVDVPILYVKTVAGFMPVEYAIRQIFEKARAQAPCLLVLEDLDSLINDHTRSVFLNEVDGLEENQGIFMIATTNHLDKIDGSLANRPSRFDRKYSFPNPTEHERRLYAVYWQKKLTSNKLIDFPDSLLDEVASTTADFSFAYMKEAFVSTLLVIARERTDDHENDFRSVLLEQINLLAKQIESGEGVSAFTKSSNFGFGSPLKGFSTQQRNPFQHILGEERGACVTSEMFEHTLPTIVIEPENL